MSKLNTAMMLFKNSKFSIEEASRFADLSIYEFMNECKKNNIAVITYKKDELEYELKILDI